MESTELVVLSSPLATIGDLTLEQVQKDFAPVREWRYSFPGKKGANVEGLSSDGVQDGVRQMARKGEAIRCIEVRLEKDTDTEAYFIAHAGRYAISPDGKEILLDSTIRAKRVEKFEKKADGTGKYFNEDWFEHGVTKAARNAEEALMPEALKQWMLAESRKAPALAAPAQNGRQRAPESRSAPQQPEAVQAPTRPQPPAPPEPPKEPTQGSMIDPNEADASEWWGRTRAAKIERSAVLRACAEKYSKEPIELTHDEREELYAALVTA